MKEPTIRLHRFEPASRANGPGLRAVIWVQGCSLGCPGCFNPETHDPRGGEGVPVSALLDRILALHDQIEGLTISGGEPAHQHRALAELLRQVREKTNLSILAFTGYDMDELQRFKGIDRFLAHIDILIAGRYDATRRIANGLIGSANKQVHFLTSRYQPADLEPIPQAEIIIKPNGEVILSGIDPLKW